MKKKINGGKITKHTNMKGLKNKRKWIKITSRHQKDVKDAIEVYLAQNIQ